MSKMTSDVLSKQIFVHLCGDTDVKQIDLNVCPTTEDVCIELSKQLGIGPVARYIFGLCIHGTNVFCPDHRILNSQCQYDFRLRFKVPSLSRLRKIDINAFNYYFHQVRGDVMDNKIPDISYDKFKQELVGLGVADMYRVMLEKGVDRESVESDYKKYIPKEVIKHHYFLIKKPIHDSLCRIKKGGNHDAWYVKGQYLKQFEDMAPNYLTEEYRAETDESGCTRNIFIRINPFHKDMPGISYRYDVKKEWIILCSIEDLCYISMRNDHTLELSRKNGIPSYLKFSNINMLMSFVGLLDGYYRLMVKWTFNLCRDVPTPALQRLYLWKCHGPVGGEFSYAKLEEKRNNSPGCFILRESEAKYNVYYLDVCTEESSKPKTFKIEKIGMDQYKFSKDDSVHTSIPRLIASYRSKSGDLVLQECLPPSEYDKSHLLLCHLDNQMKDDSSTENLLAELHLSSPQCIDVKTLQVYQNQKKDGKSGICTVHRCLWKATKTKKVEVALKVLKSEHKEKHLGTFMELAGRWAFLQSNSIVKLFGVTLTSPVAMMMEYLSIGPLDAYLKEHASDMKQVDLVEAGSYLANALWHLEEHGIVHGNIRCWKLLVYVHDENTFQVKLSDPGLYTITPSDIHWIPVECFSSMDITRASVAADVWAFGTTLWQIFAYGQSPAVIPNLAAVKKFYHSGNKLPKPRDCPDSIYKLMTDCWDLDPYRRKNPQTIMRDINHILYGVFNSRRTHSYATAFPKDFQTLTQAKDSKISDSKMSISSGETEVTLLDYSKTLLMNGTNSNSSSTSDLPDIFSCIGNQERLWLQTDNLNYNEEDLVTPDISTIVSLFTFPQGVSSIDTTVQSIFELDGDCNVVLQGRIGQGFYGEVYKGTLERGNEVEPQLVAVKKLKTNALNACIQDFEREISIMKTLKHPNIVEIKGVIQEPEISLVMEFVQHGSLQCYLKIHKESLEHKILLKFALDVAKGMEYLGKKNIVHRDLAARNILVANEHHVKISDFGLAQVMEANGYYIIKTSRELPIKWYAPESLRDGKFSLWSDVWSYGVTLYEMFSRGEDPRLPMVSGEDQQAILSTLESGTRLPCPSQCPQTIYVQLMTPCWQADPHQRPSFSQLVLEVEEMMCPTGTLVSY